MEGLRMKPVKTILFIVLILSVTNCTIPSSIEAQSVEIMIPDFTITGAFTPDDQSINYGMAIEEIGVYRISLNASGDPQIYLSVQQYQYGSPSIIATCSPNSTSIFKITPGSFNLGAIYQLTLNPSVSVISENVYYELSIERLDSLFIQGDFQYNELLETYGKRHFILTASNEYNGYLFISDTYYTYSVAIYDTYGLLVQSLMVDYYPYEHMFLLAPGVYHIFIELQSSYSSGITFQITPETVPSATPDTSLDLNFSESQTYQYFQLVVDEGTQYSISLDPIGNEDVYFFLGPFLFSYYGYYGYMVYFDDWGSGITENVTDITFSASFITFTGWDYNAEIEYTRSDRNIIEFNSYYYDFYSLDTSSILLIVCSRTIGSAVLEVSEGIDPNPLSPDVAASCHFDAIDGPFTALFNLNGLSGGHLYKFTIDHNAQENCILEPYYRIYSTQRMNQNYLFNKRPLLTDSEKIEWDQQSYRYSTLPLSHHLERNEICYYSPIDANQFLLAYISDQCYSGSVRDSEINKGDVQLSIEEVPASSLALNSPITVDSSPLDTALYTMQLEADCMYEIKVTGTELQSHGYSSLYNQTGHQLAYSWTTMHASDRFSKYYLAQIQCTGQHFLVVTTKGDAPVTITVTKLTPNGESIGVPFFVGGLVVAAAEGILIGVVIGKLRFGKETPG